MVRWSRDDERTQRDVALLQTILVHGVPVRVLARAMGVSRQTVYRRMQQARVHLRRAAELSDRRPDDED